MSANTRPPAVCTHGAGPPAPQRLPKGSISRHIASAIGGMASVITWKWLTQNETWSTPSSATGSGRG